MSDLILYSYFRSSASHRVRIALYLKGLEFEYRAVHLLNNGGEQFSSEYAKLNPSREVPALVHKGRAIAQSMAIIDYLDSVKPEPRLFPKDPFQRALVTQACEIVNSGAQPLFNLRVLNELEKRFGADQEKKNAWAGHWLHYSLKSLEDLLKPHAKGFCFGDEPTAADCFVNAHFASAERFKIDLASYPTLARIKANCAKLEAFRKAAPNAQPDTPAEH